MYKHVFLNPFYWFAFVWSAVLVMYQFQWTTLYGALDASLFVFFIVTILLSVVFGVFFGQMLKKINIKYHRPSKRTKRIITWIIVLGFLLEFLYERHIPLIAELINSGYTYKDFTGIPTFHVFLVTFAEFATVYFFYCFCFETDKKEKRSFLWLALIPFALLASLYNRAALVTIIFMCALIRLSIIKKIKLRYIVVVVLLALLVLYAFGVFGNIRSGDKWNDSSYIIEVAHIDLKKYPSFFPKEFLWAYVYLVSPLGNLNNQILKTVPTYNLDGFLYYLLPDALSKRIFPNVDTSFELTQPLLTVCTGFAGIYKYGGMFGMLFMYACLGLFCIVVAKITMKRSDSFMVSIVFVCCVTFLMFFDDFLNYMGFTFALAYSIAMALWRKPKSKVNMRLATSASAS